MKIKDQVVSLNLAKKLKKLGVEQDSLWYWIYNMVERVEKPHLKLKQQTTSWKVNKEDRDGGVIKYYSAFTVAELGNKLPGNTFSFKDKAWICRWRDQVKGSVEFTNYQFPAKSEANARAKCLIYLIENTLPVKKEE